MTAYYNEIDPFAAQWLRNLISAGHIALGEVDERSIVEVDHRDLRGFDQYHFFAGIGVWSHSLRLAGWPDDRPVWTGSCPCQPFSSAGAGKEFADERHLWPAWFELIRLCRPVAIFGEQVASKDALAWLDHVCADLEGEDYTVGAVDTCAAGFGAPHIRQRLYWVADADGAESGLGKLGLLAQGGVGDGDARGGERTPRALADSNRPGQRGGGRNGLHRSGEPRELAGYPGQDGRMDDSDGTRRAIGVSESQAARQSGVGIVEAGATNGFWYDAEWLPCRDGKARPTEPGTFPLAHGASQRVGRLRAYGNCIVAPQAAAFIAAAKEVMP